MHAHQVQSSQVLGHEAKPSERLMQHKTCHAMTAASNRLKPYLAVLVLLAEGSHKAHPGHCEELVLQQVELGLVHCHWILQ